MIIRNSGICNNCREHIVSKSRHDYVRCNCGSCFVDGGKEYLRRGGPLVDTSITEKASIKVIRELFQWGTTGKSGRQPLHLIPLERMETDHIKTLLNKFDLKKPIKEIFERELLYRISIN